MSRNTFTSPNIDNKCLFLKVLLDYLGKENEPFQLSFH